MALIVSSGLQAMEVGMTAPVADIQSRVHARRTCDRVDITTGGGIRILDLYD